MPTASVCGMFISTSAWIGPPACSLRSAARPSQNWAIARLELNTVGEFTGPAFQPWPMEVLRLSVPPIDRLWQVLQEMIPDIDRRGSNHSFLPSSTLPASDTCAASIGLIGSSRTVAAHALPATANATATPSTFIFVMTLLLVCSAKKFRWHGSRQAAAGLVFLLASGLD